MNFKEDDFHLPLSIDQGARHRDQLMDILRHPQLAILFQGYLKSIFCNEALCFFMDVEEYKDIDDPEIRKTRAKVLFDKYFTVGSDYELNTGEDLLAKLREALKNPKKDSFDEVQQHVFVTMVDDCLPNFLTWDLYFEFVSDAVTRKVFLCGIRRTNSVQQINRYTEKFGKEIVAKS